MAEDKAQAFANVNLSVQVRLDSPWGPEATLESVRATACREALETLRRLFQQADGGMWALRIRAEEVLSVDIRLTGPVVTEVDNA